MKKQAGIIGIVLAILLSLCSIQSLVQAAGFVDVPSRAAAEVNYLADGKIANGSSATTFGTDKTVTRAEAAAFIGRALQLDGTKRTTDFIDVGAGSFASGYIQSAVDKEIFSGYDGGRFLPGKEVTRGEMAVMVSKAFNYSFGGTLSGAAKALTSRGIAQGVEDGTFGADQLLKRGDFAVFLARAINPDFRLIKTDEFTKTMWANVGDLNVRSGPSTAYASKGKLTEDEKVSAAHKVGDWVYIKSAEVTGFVNAFYLRDTETKSATSDPRLSKQTIILDPGHGGTDSGASGYGILEKDVVLDTSLKVNELFKKTPFTVKLTRSTDTFIELGDRTAFAKNNNGNVFVSVHANAFNKSANGTETYYYGASNTANTADSKLLAEKIQVRMLTALQLKDRGVKKTSVLYVLKNNTMAAALAELGFIDQAGDNEKLKSEYWRNAAAKAIYYGILDYYKAKGYDVDSLYEEAK
ncbi:N-acetylmuramoyl-L-alanine amidase [Domibacillus sp. DTU_2020_1001157_1_SI_ALB_TIR_016]|uniref:N-acetylmuramoyl-L-alanine amidase n=1 Tax=Domibacillus sp. DTU_2020_1001157_1_SI_ALB_TIR_016 TaxID=3077789 RepID=UPI0028E2F6C5|nr:N-acetylmuramoyl-L-alanine amidase [Domibacillus sp. DTU_2020_1001157_1_SI_ALB_TIR_016]WNS78983.1 N-acetylmuramoyl-L-alanine amidase [Domibacillus sp. DTU_2020_1001157_1_SI_ALB_TIR_016]